MRVADCLTGLLVCILLLLPNHIKGHTPCFTSQPDLVDISGTYPENIHIKGTRTVAVYGTGFMPPAENESILCMFGGLHTSKARYLSACSVLCEIPLTLRYGNNHLALSINSGLDYALPVSVHAHSKATVRSAHPDKNLIVGDLVCVQGTDFVYTTQCDETVYAVGNLVSSALLICEIGEHSTSLQLVSAAGESASFEFMSLTVATDVNQNSYDARPLAGTVTGGTVVVAGQTNQDQNYDCWFGSVGPIKSRSQLGTEISCISPSLSPGRCQLALGRGWNPTFMPSLMFSVTSLPTQKSADALPNVVPLGSMQELGIWTLSNTWAQMTLSCNQGYPASLTTSGVTCMVKFNIPQHQIVQLFVNGVQQSLVQILVIIPPLLSGLAPAIAAEGRYTVFRVLGSNLIGGILCTIGSKVVGLQILSTVIGLCELYGGTGSSEHIGFTLQRGLTSVVSNALPLRTVSPALIDRWFFESNLESNSMSTTLTVHGQFVPEMHLSCAFGSIAVLAYDKSPKVVRCNIPHLLGTQSSQIAVILQQQHAYETLSTYWRPMRENLHEVLLPSGSSGRTVEFDLLGTRGAVNENQYFLVFPGNTVSCVINALLLCMSCTSVLQTSIGFASIISANTGKFLPVEVYEPAKVQRTSLYSTYGPNGVVLRVHGINLHRQAHHLGFSSPVFSLANGIVSTAFLYVEVGDPINLPFQVNVHLPIDMQLKGKPVNHSPQIAGKW
eukprot:CAMPEP_0183788964 /NCGR_PEP_ID=MMETSP0803_2-20130417/120_1 /TAXON_ID=195967 /ORGANISM="Crustomastix stigmata, Strain CCMP3273" /LENGTH=725 /DNA_ID=CAMNT_0026033115 /DNA_START=400 /DNA_END=2574 /DNA_ORIENTATION=-